MLIFEIEKLINPSFVQGLTKKAFKSLIKKFVNSSWQSVSKDGSAFEGNQKYNIRKYLVDIKMPFYRRILDRLIRSWKEKYPNIFTCAI